ncbi:MAG: GNAT family N-acetyltransferase [Dehalococcoidia bacterium]|nr:GNAT family N-acetyltransferase [Dehalococcoidia bacterium]
MTAEASLDIVRAYWTAQLGFDPDLANGVLVARPEGTLRQYAGVYAFRHGYSCIVSPPAAYRAPLAEALRGRSPDEAFDVAVLTAPLGDAAGAAIGPAWIGVADAQDATLHVPAHVRLLDARDRPALEALAAAVGPLDWEHGAIELDRAPIFGVFEEGALVAAASYEAWGDGVRAVGFVTDPRWRRRGRGAAAATAATAQGLADGAVMLWQTLETNAASLAVARRLGFQPYARTIAVRLRT